MKRIKYSFKPLSLVFMAIIFLSACSDSDGTNVNDAVNSQDICQTTSQTFQLSVVGLGNVNCTQTSLKDSSLIGLLLLSGLEVNPNELSSFDQCQGQLLLDVACNDPSNVLVFHETCTIEQPKPVCTTDISPNQILINAIAVALGVNADQVNNQTLQDALAACQVASNTPLLQLTTEQVQCVLNNLKTGLTQ